MLDIGIIIPQLDKYGGAERVLVECVARWQERHRITVYSTTFREELLKEHGVGRKVSLVKLSPYFEGANALFLNGVLLPKIWEQEIGEHDIYHAHIWPTHLIDRHPMVWYPNEPLRILSDLRFQQPVDGAAAAGRTSVHVYPKFTYDRPSDVHFEATLNALDLCEKLGRPDRIVANSRYSASCIEAVYQRPVRDVVYPGVRVDDFIHLPSDEDIVLSVGQLWAHKRTRLAVEAVAQVEGMQLYVVGQGPEKETLQRMARVLGVSDRVFFLERVTNEELRILFSRCLALLFTAIREPFGIVPLETLAAGKPLIAVDEGGYTEIVDSSCAILVPPVPGKLAEAVRYLKDHKDIAQAMGRAGLARARQYTWDRTAEEMLRIIEETARDHARANRRRTRRPLRAGGPLFGVQYFAWYGDGAGAAHWNDNPDYGGVTDMPALGHYASSHGSTLEAHFALLEECGVDFAVVNLHVNDLGVKPSYEWASLEHIFRVAEKRHTRLRFAVQLCFYTNRRAETAEAIRQVRAHFMKQESYLRIQNRPVLFVFWTGAFDGNEHWLRQFRQLSDGCIRIAASLRPYPPRSERQRTAGVFDGFTLFSPLDLADEAGLEKIWREAYRNSSAGAEGLRIITVSPGYDDTHLRDPDRSRNRHRCIDRREGQTYQRMINFALSVPDRPDMILVSTFNEYHENTHIEPSLKYGRRYLDMTGNLIRAGKKQWQP